MSKSKMESFVKQFVAFVEGDDATVTAEKSFRQASSALKSHISSYEGDTIDLETKVEDAKEAFENARVNNGNLITDRGQYVSNLISKREAVLDAQEALDAHLDTIKFLKEQFKALA